MKRTLADELMILIDGIDGSNDEKIKLFEFAAKIDAMIDDIYRERTQQGAEALAKMMDMQSDFSEINLDNVKKLADTRVNMVIGRIMFSGKWSGTFADLVKLKGND